MNRSEQFQHNGRTYEIRAISKEDGCTVRTFLDGKPVSPRYSITFETAIDMVNSGWGDAVNNLMALARSDVINGRLLELAKALKANRSDLDTAIQSDLKQALDIATRNTGK